MVTRRKLLAVGCALVGLGIGYVEKDSLLELIQPKQSRLERNLRELKEKYPDIGILIKENNFTFIETTDPQKVLEMGSSAKTDIAYDREMQEISSIATIYTGEKEAYYLNNKGRIEYALRKTEPVIKTDILHEILETDIVKNQLKNNSQPNITISHMAARRRQLDYDVGLSLNEYLYVYADYLGSGGREFPEQFPVNNDGIVEAGNVKWGKINGSIPIETLIETHRPIDMPYIQGGVRKAARISY